MRKIFVALLLMSCPLWAETTVIKGVGKTRSLTLRAGDHLEVKGTGHKVTVHGQGGRIELHGSTNEMTVEGASDAIEIHGTANRMRLDAAVPDVNLHGTSNTLTVVKRPNRPIPAINRHGTGNQVVTEEVRP